MLTLYYVSATFLQSWRISKICQKITDQLAQQATISFYVLPPEKDHGFYSRLATSELCSNRQVAKVSDILWLQGNNRGCSLMPLQSLPTSAWITFPDVAPGLQPFYFCKAPDTLQRSLNADKHGLIRLLLETETKPCYDLNATQKAVVRVENYGRLIAWKIDSNLAIIIETDIEHFTKLLIDTFLQNHFLINDQLPLLRIESVRNYGLPQPYSQLSSHVRKPTRNADECKVEQWSKHLEDLRALGVLAKQAIEYTSNKNKSESSKKDANKPDLIPMEKQRSLDEEKKKSEESPKKPHVGVQKGLSFEKPSQDQPRSSKTDSPRTVSPEKVKVLSKQSEEIKKSQPQTEAKQTAALNEQKPIVSMSQTATTSNVNLPASPNKTKTKPTEIKKPGTVRDSGRFKASKVSETPADIEAKKSSELEKIAAAKVADKTKVTPSKDIENIDISSKAPKPNTETQAKTKSTTQLNEKPATKKSEQATSSHAITTSKTQPSVVTTSTEKQNIPEIGTPNKKPLPNTAATSVASSANKDNAKRPSLKRHKDSIKECKPLNVLVYAESATARESAIIALKEILAENTYTIYPMTQQQASEKHWKDTAALLVVCGSVATPTGELFVDYFLHGGKVLSLCSDVLHFILPTYRTAEVREHELVQFSYDKWQKVKMMHHIFCYQPSPVKKNFSTDSDDSANASNRKPALVCPPRSIELKDLKGHLHQLDVKVLGTEETWNTPSLMLAHNQKNGGSAVFSQVHLEISPSEFESDESKYSILKQNDKIRQEIFSDLLKKHLSLTVKPEKVISSSGVAAATGVNGSAPKCVFNNAYFLGRHEAKFQLLEKLKEKTGADNSITTPNLIMKFCGPDDKLPNVNSNILPILIHSCPEDFSTVEYFDNLKTQYVGRLVIYTPVINSSQNVITDLELTDGIAVIPRQQTAGMGRSNNQWLSPLGCAMFSLQLHISLNSPLGKRLPLIQHIIGTAMVQALKGHDQYKVLNIGLKWPNDTYANGITKIGGLVVKTTIFGTNAIVNIGCGINLDNDKPTICINDMVREYNNSNQKKLPLLKYEQFIAMMFNEIEQLIDMVQKGDFEKFYKLYYELWMHSEQHVSIVDKDGSKKESTVTGIDEYGYLQVKLANGTTQIVMPDGNSFDMLQGLIVPKYN